MSALGLVVSATIATSSAAAEVHPTVTATAPSVVASAIDTLTELVRPRLSLEYRVRHQLMDPLSLSDTSAPLVSYFDQRLRVSADVGLGSKVRLRSTVDVLDGVLFGDNGSFVGTPRKNRGSIVSTRGPNLTKLSIGKLDPDGASLDRQNYGFVLADADLLTLRTLYGEVVLPFGILRAGRQPLATGRDVLVNDGSRSNRWGIAKSMDTADGVSFGTKLSAIFDALSGRPIDPDQSRGLFLALIVAEMYEGLPGVADDLMQYAGSVWYLAKDERVLGFDVQRLKATLTLSQRLGDQFDTSVTTIAAGFDLEVGPLFLTAHHVQLFGGTREISEGLAVLATSSGPPTRQPIEAFGGFAEIAYRFMDALSLSMELYYATGDEDPRSTTPITQFTFTEDTNVGLHLFENVVAYQTARSAALGVANLKAVRPPSYPVAEVDTRGGLQNAIVLFPQVLSSPWPWLGLRGGVMFAFTAVPSVDPIGTLLRSDGKEINDDKVNYAGGKPGSYWGTEIDLGITLRPVDHCLFDLEAAYLMPGNALQNEDGVAVNSFFLSGRLTLFL
ncbi:MAG: hypothetical protein U1E65_11615 [Myxococcota bacterium]